MIIFFKGSRLTPDKLEASQKFAKERNLPVLNNVLLPRLKGFLASAQNLREDLDGIIDLTLVYKNRPPNFMSLFFGKYLYRLNYMLHAKISISLCWQVKFRADETKQDLLHFLYLA